MALSKKTIPLMIILVTALLLGAACSSGAPAPNQYTVPDAGLTSSSSSSNKSDTASLDTNRLVVRTADIVLEVSEPSHTRDKIAELAVRYQGYVVSSEFRGQSQGMSGKITIRVAADQFDAAMVEIRAMGIQVVSETSTTQDATAQYVDLKARLSNAQATEAQYLTLLTKAQQINDIILVQDKLSQIRQTIEQLQGQIQYLETTSSTSLISITLQPDSSSQPVVEGGWSLPDNVKSAAHGFIEFGKVFLTILIWVGIFSPVWGVPLGIRYWRRRRRRSRPPTPPAEKHVSTSV